MHLQQPPLRPQGPTYMQHTQPPVVVGPPFGVGMVGGGYQLPPTHPQPPQMMMMGMPPGGYGVPQPPVQPQQQQQQLLQQHPPNLPYYHQ
jgi:hypothetical protein